jgi:hypothetical protein
MSKTKELIIPEEITGIELYSEGGMNKWLELIEKEARGLTADLSTDKGRKEIASMAHKVAKAKVRFDDLGKTLTDEHRKKVDAVNEERRSMRDRLDSLKEEVRKPLTEWENEEAEKKANIDKMIAYIKELSFVPLEDDSAKIEEKLDMVKKVKIDDSFGDQANIASIEKEKSIEKLEAQLDTVKKREADEAELERLRKEQAERDEKDRLEREEKERLAREEEIRKQEQERVELEAKKREEKLKREKEEAEQREKEAKEKAARDAKEAEERIEREKAAAAQAERDRIAAEEKAEREAAEKREANKKHQAKINNAVVSGLVQVSGIKEAEAKAIVTAIAKGEIPHVSIQY